MEHFAKIFGKSFIIIDISQGGEYASVNGCFCDSFQIFERWFQKQLIQNLIVHKLYFVLKGTVMQIITNI